MTDFPAIESGNALFEILKRDLGYCACAYEDAVPVLHELLRRVVQRSDSVKDLDVFYREAQNFEQFLFSQSSSGMGSWMIYTLEKADLLYHGSNVLDVWITRKGRWLLEALDRFPNPQPDLKYGDDDDDDENT